MRFFILLSIALAVNGHTLRNEQTWRPAVNRDRSQYHIKEPKVDIDGKIVPGATSRIINGEEVAPHSFPDQVALFIDDYWVCGGTLISKTKVLTAAHCTSGAKQLVVIVGGVDPYNLADDGLEITTTEFVVHPDWIDEDYVNGNDLSVVTLPEPVQLSDIVKIGVLADKEPAAGTNVTITGWGMYTDAVVAYPPGLRKVDVDIMSDEVCGGPDWYQVDISPKVICTKGDYPDLNRGSCSGDSGGPLRYNGKQIGIVSFGSSAGCEVGWPSGFTSVPDFKEWIMQQ